MALNKWLFDTVAAPYIDKAAEKAHAKFEVKIADGQAELYKLLSSKSPDKKQ